MNDDKKVQVFLSLTTLPSRIDSIAPVIESLLNQTYPFDLLCLYVPKLCVRQNASYVIPEKLLQLCEKDPRFVIKAITEDLGPGTKIIPAISDTQSNKAHFVLISVDDDIILETHAVEELVAAHFRHPLSILGFMGVIQEKYVHAEYVPHDVHPVDSVGGYRSVLYPQTACTLMLPFLQQLHQEHMTCLKRPIIDDDHALQCCAILCNIPRNVVKTHFPCTQSTPETRMIALLNFRFVSNTDGVSGRSASEDQIFPSRNVTDAFFTKHKKI